MAGVAGGAGHSSQWKEEQKKEARKKRDAAAAKKREHNHELIELLQKYDKNGNKKLEKAELEALLTETKSSTEPGVPPTEEEVKWIIRVADKPKRGEKADGCIDLTELEEAIGAFATLEDVREDLEAVLAKYLVAGDAENKRATLRCMKLPIEDLDKFLTELNGGAPVAQHDHALVLKWLPDEWQSSKVTHLPDKELLPAAALWYSDVKPPQSTCCVVQ